MGKIEIDQSKVIKTRPSTVSYGSVGLNPSPLLILIFIIIVNIILWQK